MTDPSTSTSSIHGLAGDAGRETGTNPAPSTDKEELPREIPDAADRSFTRLPADWLCDFDGRLRPQRPLADEASCASTDSLFLQWYKLGAETPSLRQNSATVSPLLT
jgi:hypothetical protein